MATNVQQIKAEYRVSDEQLDRCNLIFDGRDNRYFYQVESATTPGTEYTVRYDLRFAKLTCTCAAGREGLDCWHKRASVADFAIMRLRERARRQAEQTVLEATPEVREEYALFDLEVAKHELEAVRRENAAVAKFGAKAYEHQPLKLENGIPMR